MSATARHIRDNAAVARADRARLRESCEPDPVQIEQLAEQFANDFTEYPEIADRFCGDTQLANHARGQLYEMRTDLRERMREPMTLSQQSELIRDMSRTIELLCDCIDEAAREMAREAIE